VACYRGSSFVRLIHRFERADAERRAEAEAKVAGRSPPLVVRRRAADDDRDEREHQRRARTSTRSVACQGAGGGSTPSVPVACAARPGGKSHLHATKAMTSAHPSAQSRETRRHFPGETERSRKRVVFFSASCARRRRRSNDGGEIVHNCPAPACKKASPPIGSRARATGTSSRSSSGRHARTRSGLIVQRARGLLLVSSAA